MGKIYWRGLLLGGRRAAVVGGLVVLGATTPIACSGGPDAPAARSKSTPTLGGNATHAIHVFAGQPGGPRTLLNFGPGTELSLHASPESSSSPDGGTGLTTAATIDTPGADINATAWALVARAALACNVAPESTAIQLPPWSYSTIFVTSLAGQYPDWYVYGFRVQGNTINISPLENDCADRLLLEQNLICTADKLAQISDAVGDVVWPAATNGDFAPPTTDCVYGPEDGGIGVGACQFASQWDIPPQADSDRFIVRDLAIHTLGMIPVLDSYTDIAGQSCAASYADVANNTPGWVINSTSAGQSVASEIFGVNIGSTGQVYPFFPPSAVPFVDTEGNSNGPSIAASALAIEAQVLRGGGRLLHDLIRRDVYSDLASAAQLSAQALDPSAGNQQQWGVTFSGGAVATPQQAPYGTISHAARVLMGRWEIGDPADFPTTYQPQCEGVSALGLVPGALGSDLPARVSDLPIRTPGEATASQLVDSTGLVVGSCEITISQAAALRSALIDQLVIKQELADGIPINSTGPLRSVFASVVNAISDAEIAFAFQRALSTFLLLTNMSDTSTVADEGCQPWIVPTTDPDAGTAIDLPGGLQIDPTNVGGISGLNGVVVAGGLDRSRLHTDPMARAGGMLEASACGEALGTSANSGWSSWGIPTISAPPTSGTVAPTYTLPVVDFQDSFSVAQAFERRLVLLEGLTKTPAITGSTNIATGSSTNPEAVARGGIAEIRSWAGSTIVHATPTPSGTTSAATSVVVDVAGMSNPDLGLAPAISLTSGTTSILGLFGFVYGPPWVAECAAGVRADCPANFATTYIRSATSVSPVTPNPGVLDNEFQLVVPLTSSTATNFTPQVAVNNSNPGPSTSHLYMVRLHDPTSPAGHGYVMGTIRLSGVASNLLTCVHATCTTTTNFAYDTFSFVDAPMQRELVHDALDLGQWVGATPPALGDQSSAQTSGYCVDGVPRNIFVPLDNELINGGTSYEDSWQEYLTLAQQAAQSADTLGQQLIANDLQISENEQSAAEQLANLCGDFGSLSSVTVATNGTTTAGTTDPTTSTCLSEPMTDIAFLGTYPSGYPANGSPSQITSFLQGPAVLNCPPTPSTTTSALCSKSPLTAGALGVITPAPTAANLPSQTPFTPPCSSLVSTATQGQIQGSLVGGGFQASAFLNVLQNAALSASAIGNVVESPLQMTVDQWDNWSVTIGGSLIMSSTNASYWPACLQDNAGCGSLAGSVGGAVAVALNHSFRWCPSGTYTPGLGCDAVQPLPSGPQPTPAQAELNTLKWRVMQALWTLAVANGDVPSGMFTVPAPVATTCTGLPWPACYAGSLTESAPCPTGSSNCLNGWTLTGASSQDIDTVGTVYDIPVAFSAFMQNAAVDVPTWYRNLYNGQTSVKHKFAVSNGDTPMGVSPLFSGTAYVCAFINDAPLGGPQYCQFVSALRSGVPQGVQESLSAIFASTSNMDGLRCLQPWGEPAGGHTPLVTVRGPWDSPVLALDYSALPNPAPWSVYSFLAATQSPIPSPATITSHNVNLLLDYDLASPGPNVLNWAMNTSGNSPISASTLSPTARILDFTGAADSPGGQFTSSSNGTCNALSQMLQAATLVCASGPAITTLVNGGTFDPGHLPQVTTPDDIVRLEAWLAEASAYVSNTAGLLYVTSIPTRVVTDFQTNQVGSGDLGGTKGQAILDLEQNLQAIPVSWTQISTDLSAVQSALTSARIGILSAGLQQTAADQSLEMTEINVQGQMAQASIGFLSTIAKAVTSAVTIVGIPAAVGEVSLGAMSLQQSQATGNAELGVLNQQQATAAANDTNNVAGVLATLNQTTSNLWGQITTQSDTIRTDVLKSLADSQQIQLVQGQAAYQAAVGTGADFVNIAGQEVPIPVDTVLRRQASATEQRYQTALTNAKALAYMARRAIEQRIGITLDAITVPVGPLAAPASWADDICSLTGVNYAALSSASLAPGDDGGVDGGGIGGSQDTTTISQFADSWVGDYVAKLQNFVTYYNAQYPSHQGSDTAVVSLLSNLLPPVPECSAIGPNLLLNSGDLEVTVDPATTLPGWEKNPCPAGSATCLAVLDGLLLQPPLSGPAGFSNSAGSGNASDLASGITWLADIAETATDAGASGDAGAADASAFDGGSDAGLQQGWPPNLVSQQVQLQPGTYVLSWWDQARDLCGNLFGSGAACSTPPPSSPVSYVATVYDANWNQVSIFYNAPFVPASGAVQVADDGGSSLSLWSQRNTLSFTVTAPGTYYIAFGASTLGNGPGSVAIADVQLELAPASGRPSPYVGTGGSLLVTSYNCPPSVSDLQAAFQHNCNQNGTCTYDLIAPVIINTQALNAGQTPLNGVLAPGNYNYRHDTLALNLVGTGVHNCANDPTNTCYGAGYVQYNLQHDATSAGILDYNGNVRVFDFGIGSINGGKALAAEQYITMPLSSDDQSLISQPGILHEELSGRPLDGSYTLSILDSPDLNWSALQDVQFVFNYDYWSAIQVSGNTGDAKQHLRLGHPRAKPIPRARLH